MKIRNGFVSNSSSSSFIVVFPHEPTSAEDVHVMLFGTADDTTISLYDEYKESSQRMAAWIWEDIQYQNEHPDSKLDLIENAKQGVDEALEKAISKFLGPEPDYRDPAQLEDFRVYYRLRQELTDGVCQYRVVKRLAHEYYPADEDDVLPEATRKAFWEEQDKYRTKLDAFHWAAVMQEIGTDKFYVFHYGDSHGSRQSIVLEHGGVFNRVKHWQFSHH